MPMWVSACGGGYPAPHSMTGGFHLSLFLLPLSTGTVGILISTQASPPELST